MGPNFARNRLGVIKIPFGKILLIKKSLLGVWEVTHGSILSFFIDILEGVHARKEMTHSYIVIHHYLQEWMSKAVYLTVLNFMNIGLFMKDKSYTLQWKHILGAAYEAICGPKGMLSTSDDLQEHDVHVPSATKLASGITIRAVSGPLCSMSYADKCLSLPKISLVTTDTSFANVPVIPIN